MRMNVTTRSSLIAVSRVVPTLGSSLTFISGEINRYCDDNLSLYKLPARFIKIRGCKLNFLFIKVHIRAPLMSINVKKIRLIEHYHLYEIL